MWERYLESVNLNTGRDFPYLCMEVENGRSVPEPPGFQVMHWHEDIQFIYVLRGGLLLHTLAGTAEISAGQGGFINKNVVHMVAAAASSHYKSFVFPERLVAFYPGGPAGKYVRRVTDCPQLAYLPLTPEADWQRRILEQLWGLWGLAAERTVCYEYEVLTRLAALWLELIRNIDLPDKPPESDTQKRMQAFLRYIEEHYGEGISLEQLAGSASVSKSECLRCFRATVQTTPYRYLLEYRLQKAAELLSGTELPLSQVALTVGFQSQSHFGKLFKERTGYSPKKYREGRQ